MGNEGKQRYTTLYYNLDMKPEKPAEAILKMTVQEEVGNRNLPK